MDSTSVGAASRDVPVCSHWHPHHGCYMATRDLKTPSVGICILTSQMLYKTKHCNFHFSWNWKTCSSVAKSSPNLCKSMDCSTLGFPVLHYLLELAQTQCPLSQGCHRAISSSVAPFSLCPQSFPALVSFPISRLSIRWPEYWNFSFSISPSNEYSGSISFRIDCFDLLAIQGFLRRSYGVLWQAQGSWMGWAEDQMPWSSLA